jgi:hypothetical protein
MNWPVNRPSPTPLEYLTDVLGHLSRSWTTTKTSHGKPAIFVRFSPTDCVPCPAHSLYTRSKNGARELTLIPPEAYLASQAARQRQSTEAFTQRYAIRAGIEGTLSQAVNTLDLRRARYIGLAKTQPTEYPTGHHRTADRYGDRHGPHPSLL